MYYNLMLFNSSFGDGILLNIDFEDVFKIRRSTDVNNKSFHGIPVSIHHNDDFIDHYLHKTYRPSTNLKPFILFIYMFDENGSIIEQNRLDISQVWNNNGVLSIISSNINNNYTHLFQHNIDKLKFFQTEKIVWSRENKINKIFGLKD